MKWRHTKEETSATKSEAVQNKNSSKKSSIKIDSKELNLMRQNEEREKSIFENCKNV